MKKRTRRLKRVFNPAATPAIGKYIDTLTKAELKVLYFSEDAQQFKISTSNMKGLICKGCRFQIAVNQAKRKRKFYNKLVPYINLWGAFGENDYSKHFANMPVIFGLLKLRQKKSRKQISKLVLVESANCFTSGKVINITAAVVDNLLYLELVDQNKGN